MKRSLLALSVLLLGCPQKDAAPAPPAPKAAEPAEPPGQGTVLAKKLCSPTGLIVDDANVYWLNGDCSSFSPELAPAGLYRAPKTGGPAVLLAHPKAFANLVADAHDLYWSDIESLSIFAVSKSGGEARVLAKDVTGLASGLGIDDAFLYFAAGGTITLQNEQPALKDGKLRVPTAELSDAGDGAIWKLAKKGGAPVKCVKNLPMALGPKVDGNDLLWRAFFGGTLLRAPKKGGTPKVVVEEKLQWSEWTFDDRDLYWAVGLSPAELKQLPKAGGTPKTLAHPAKPPSELTIDGPYLYWVDNDGVRRVKREGGEIETVATKSTPGSLALDAKNVYWSDALTVRCQPK